MIAWINFPPVELVKITRQFVTVGPVHCFQLSLHLTPDFFYGVRVGSCVRIDKVLRMVHHEMYITAIVQVEVGRKLVRNDESSGFNEVLHKATRVSLVRSGTRKVRALPLPLSTMPNTQVPLEMRPLLYFRLWPNIDSSISTVSPRPPNLMRYIPVMANTRREGKLLPLKFDERFYE